MSLSNIQFTIAVSSCKGGVGKSTVAAALARELAKRGWRGGLVDCDIHGPSIPSLFNLQRAVVLVNDQKQLIPIEKEQLKIMSFGLLLGDAPAVMRGPIVTRYIQQILLNTAWGKLDFLIIDMPPGTGDVQLTITQTARLSGAVIVTTPQTLALLDVARGILMFEKVSVPILGVIENMSSFICDQCQKKHYPFGANAAYSLQERFGIAKLGELPLIPKLAALNDITYLQTEMSSITDRLLTTLNTLALSRPSLPEIQFNAKTIILKFTDGTQMEIDNRALRAHCRCALCIDEMTGGKLIKEGQVKADIAPTQIIPLGNYALSISWNDGHTSGIYPYEQMKSLAQTPR